MRFSLLHILPLCLIAASIYISEPASDEKCSNLEVVIARGTDEPLDPSFGIIVGDPLYNAVKKLVPTVIGYAVNYPASFDCDSEAIGANDTLAHLTQKAVQCPDMKYALIGYSQGADVIHQAAVNIPTSLLPSIVALVMFGDPGNKGPNSPDISGGTVPQFPSALADRLKENCAEGDPVCSDGTNPDAHLSYDNPNTTYIADSATYIATQFTSDGMVGPEPSPNDGGGSSQNSTANASALAGLASLLGGLGGSASACPSSSASSGAAVVGSSSATKPASTPSASVVPGSSPAPVSASSATAPRSTSGSSIASSASSKGSSAGVTLPTSTAPTTTTSNSLASLTVTTPVITFTGGAAPRMKILW